MKVSGPPRRRPETDSPVTNGARASSPSPSTAYRSTSEKSTAPSPSTAALLAPSAMVPPFSPSAEAPTRTPAGASSTVRTMYRKDTTSPPAPATAIRSA